MEHCSEEDLILYYYGEHPRKARVERHLDGCPSCATDYRDLVATLSMIAAPPAPDRNATYGLEVWHRIRHRLPEQEAGWRAWSLWQYVSPAAAGAAVTALVVAAFVAGRVWPIAERETSTPAAQAADLSPESSERARLIALAEHFERSEHVLLDVATADDDSLDVTAQQAWASGLLTSNRLYREASASAGDEPVAAVLDELERVLVDLVHGPAVLTREELDEMQLRLEAAALLFKVRVLSNSLRDRENEPVALRTTT